MLTGYSSNTLAAIVYGSGVLFHGSTRWGVSRGGVTFNPGAELRHPEFDGMTSEIVGAHRIARYDSTIQATFLEAANAQIGRLERNQTFVGTPTAVLTPLPANQWFTKTGQYLQDVRLIGDRGDGSLETVHFPFALVREYSEKTNERGEKEFTVTLVACLDPQGTPLNLDACPYRREIRTAVP